MVRFLQSINNTGDPSEASDLHTPDDGDDAGEDVTEQEDVEAPQDSHVEVVPLLPALHGHGSLISHGNITDTSLIF